MKKLISLLLAVILLVGLCAAFTGCVPREDTLRILNWAEYIDTELITAFEAHIKDTEGRRIKVVYDTEETNELMYTKIKQGRSDYDLICPSDYMVARMATEELLKPINLENVPNAQFTSPYVTSLLEQFTDIDLAQYMVGYTWGTMGILYNPDLIKQKTGYNDQQVENLVSSWNALWAKTPSGTDIAALHNTITFKDSIRDNFLVASIYANDSYTAANDTSETNIAKVKTALLAQKSVAAYWEVDRMREEIAQDTNTTITMGLQWAGDAKYAIDTAAEEGVTLKYSIPDEGSNVFFDGWVMPIYAGNQELAEKFLNFMCDPDNAAQNMEYVGYTSVIASPGFLEGFVSDDEPAVDVAYFLGSATPVIKNISPIYYPPIEVLNNCVVMQDFGSRLNAVNTMWDSLGV